jgi:hypothetical protein
MEGVNGSISKETTRSMNGLRENFISKSKVIVGSNITRILDLKRMKPEGRNPTSASKRVVRLIGNVPQLEIFVAQLTPPQPQPNKYIT